jgi:hypothetical protein
MEINTPNAWNIKWRPRWFAYRYARQLSRDYPGWFYGGPILDVINGVQDTIIIEAAIANGIL